MTLRLSNSEMAMFRSDKRHWYFSAYRQLRRIGGDEPGSASSIGNLYHDALAAYYDPATLYADPVAYAEAKLAEAIAERPAEEDALRKEADLVLIMLQGYVEWLEEEGADADLVPEESERMLDLPFDTINGVEVRLLSKIDVAISRPSDGARWALEHKTVQTFENQLPLAKVNTQFLTEHLARFLEARIKGATDEEALASCRGVLLNMARKVKRTARSTPPFYSRIEVPHNVHELRNHWRHVWGTARDIIEARARLDGGESHHTVCPPNPTRDSTWRDPFFRISAMVDDGSDYEGALEAMYEVCDPLDRYEGAVAL